MKHLIWHNMLRCGNLILRSLAACFATENKLFLNYTLPYIFFYIC